ncbi:hypothetical protein BH23ACT9_BH23ACT9_20320 [soil metagenome]
MQAVEGISGARAVGLLVVALAALVSGLSATPSGAAGDDAPDHVVHAGAVPAGDPGKLYVFEDYYPRDLRVHRGERVRWEFPVGAHADTSFHTVTFAADPGDAPLTRSDELPGSFAFDERSFLTTGCGRPGLPVCVISDPDELVSSGSPILHGEAYGPLDPFDAVIDLEPGTYSYFCTIHHPVMQGTVEVVEDEVEVDNPAPSEFTDHIAALTAEADAVFAELARPTSVVEDGRRVWTVHAGARTREEGGVGFLGFLPASLSIRAGEAIRWTSGDEVHGVTFPDTGADGPPAYFALNCEFDDPAAGAPGVPLLGFLEFLPPGSPPGCPAGSQFELGLTRPRSGRVRTPWCGT